MSNRRYEMRNAILVAMVMVVCAAKKYVEVEEEDKCGTLLLLP